MDDVLCGVLRATLLHDHSHDSIFIRFSAFLVHFYDLIDSDIAHKVPHHKDEITGY
jgi:hypothetical protein